MNLQENILRIKEMMNIQEQIPDSRFAPPVDNRIESLPTLGIDDTIDVVSALIDVVPGLGNLVSAGIDVTHALSYIIRFFYTDNQDEKIENATLALVTLGATLIPIGGNSLPILARQSVKQIVRKTPQEIFILAKKLGLYNKTVILLSKSKWKYSILLALARIVGGELAEFLTAITKKLTDIYTKIKDVSRLKTVANAVLSLINLISELAQDANVAVELTKTNQL